MSRMAFITAITTSAMAITAGFAVARNLDGARPGFERIDADGNGEITRSEFENMHATRFNEADTDGDGLLTADELVASINRQTETRVARMLERLDANGDGALGPDEMPAQRNTARMFDRADADKNGTISMAEFDTARERMRARFERSRTDAD